MHQFAAIKLPKRDQYHGNHRRQRQLEIDIEHHLPNDHHRHHHSIKRGDDRRANGDEHCIQITCKARHQIARLVFMIVLHIQRFQMTKQIVTEFMLNRARRAKEKIAPQKPSHRERQANAKYDANVAKHAAHIHGVRGKPVCDNPRRLWNVQICKIQYK